jgi:hypothetical protein
MVNAALAMTIGDGYSGAQVQGGSQDHISRSPIALYVGKLSMTDRRETSGC